MTRRRSSRVCIRTSQSLQRSVLFATSHRRVPALSAVSTPARVIRESIKSIKSFHPLTYVAGNHRTPWPPVSPGARTSPWPCRTRAPRTPRGRVRRRCSHHHRASSRARPPSRIPRTVAARSLASPRRHLAHRSRARAPRRRRRRHRHVIIVIARGVTARALGALGGGYRPIGTLRRHPDRRSVFVRSFSFVHSIQRYSVVNPVQKCTCVGGGSRPDAWNRARMRRDDLGARGVAGRLFQTQSSAMAAEQVRIDATRWTRDARERVEDARGRDRRRTRTARGAMGRRDVRARTL